MFDEDLSAFYDEGEFASPCLRQRPNLADLRFAGLEQHSDANTLEGHTSQTVHRLRFPASVDVKRGDVVIVGEVVGAVFVGRTSYRVADVDLVNDGREAEALLNQPKTL